MSEFYHENEYGKKKSEDYYTGYYWGNHPYESNELPGRKKTIFGISLT